MVLSKRILCRYIIVFCILNPSIFLAFAPAIQILQQALQAVAQRPEIVRFVQNSASATIALVSNPPTPPPHIRAQLKDIASKAIQSAKASAAKPSARMKPFPALTSIAANLPASIKSPAISHLPAAANFAPHAFVAAAQEKLAAAIATSKIPAASLASTTTSTTIQTIKNMAQAPQTLQLCVTPSAQKPNLVIIPSQVSKNTTIATIAQKAGENPGTQPKAIIPIPPSLPVQQSIPAFQISVRAKPDGVIADLQAINSNYAKSLAEETRRINSYSQLRTAFAAQKITVSRNLKEACNLSVTPEVIKAQLTLLNNGYVHEIENFHLNYATRKMVQGLSDNNGEFTGCFSSETADKLSHFASMRVSAGEFFTNCWASLKKAVGLHKEISQKYIENTYNNSLYNFCESILKKQINEAKTFLDSITPTHAPDGCSKCQIYKNMHEAYSKLYSSVFNEHKIPRIFEQDTIWPNLKKVLDQQGPQYLQQQASAQSQLESRHNIVQFLLQKLNKQNCQEPPKFLFDIASTYQDPIATVEYLSKLSSDHPEIPVREAHSLIFGTDILPKIYDHQHLQPFKDVITVSKDLFLEKFKDIRAIHLKLTSFEPKTEQGTALMRQGFIYTQKALESDTHRAIYKNLASEILRALTEPTSNGAVFSWPDFSQPFTNPVATQIQHRILPLLNHALADRHLSTESPDLMVQMQRAHALGAIDHISKIYQALTNNDTQAALEIEKTILPHFTRNFFEEEIKKLDNKPGLTSKQIIESIVTARMILHNAQPPTASDTIPVKQESSIPAIIHGSDLRKSDSEAAGQTAKEIECARENNAEHQNAKRNHGNPSGRTQHSIDPEDPEDDDCKNESKEPKRETVLPRMQTYEQARNKALEIIGEVDPHSGTPHIGTVGIGEGKIVGRRWHGRKVTVRLDYDPKKGPHINVTDYRVGKGTKGTVVAIPFEGNLETVDSLLRHLNK